MKEELKPFLQKAGIIYMDLAPVFTDEDDYPQIATAVAKRVAKTKGALGILVCGSGVGVSIAANRVKGVRAFDAYDEQTVKLAREHNDANIIALSGWHLTVAEAKKLLKMFFATEFSKAPRHHRRVRLLG